VNASLIQYIFPFAMTKVWIGVVLEEGRDQLLAWNDLAMEEHFARPGELVRDEEVRVAQANGEEQPVPESPHADAALTV